MRRPSPSMLVALAALFVALSSSATAAVLITGKNVKDGSLTAKDIKKRSITADRLAANVLATPQGAVRPGAPGATGPAGVSGAPGVDGAAGPAGVPGAAGANGADGVAGTKGADGAPGADGAKGDKGDPTYKRTILVSPCATATASGQALLDVITPTATDCKASGRLPTGADAPSAANPWLIKLEPGTYSIGTARLVLPAYVDLEGSGSQTSRIVATDGGVNVAGASELRFVGISGTGVTADGVVHLLPAAKATLDTVAVSATVTVSSPSATLTALNVDHSLAAIVRDSVLSATATNSNTATVQSVGASPVISGSTISTSATSSGSVRALRLSAGSPVITGSRITVNGGGNGFGVVAATSGTEVGPVDVTLRDSTIDPSGGSALYANGAGAATTATQVINVYNVTLDAPTGTALRAGSTGLINVLGGIVSGGVTGPTGDLRCAGSYRGDFATARTAGCL